MLSSDMSRELRLSSTSRRLNALGATLRHRFAPGGRCVGEGNIMKINGVWVGWGLGDHSSADLTVQRAKAYMRRTRNLSTPSKNPGSLIDSSRIGVRRPCS
jgi:hypothetical protein